MKRTESSKVWLKRHNEDIYVKQARKEGYRSRAIYKLMEMDERYGLFKTGDVVIDLGAAPGSWCEYAVSKVRSDQDGGGRVIALDILDMEDMNGVTSAKIDFMSDDALVFLDKELNSGKADVIMSDMAQNTTGHRRTDHLRTLVLAEAATDFAIQNLKTGGHFVTKVFQGGTEKDMLNALKTNFETVRHVKPKASRAESVELYVIAQNKK